MEILQVIYRFAFDINDIYDPSVFVWTKLAYVFGFSTPTLADSHSDIELEIAKQFADYLWELSLTEIFSQTSGLQIPRMPDISEGLNLGKFAHMKECRSLQATILSEIAGILDAMESDFRNIFAYLYESRTGRKTSLSELSSSDSPQKFSNIIYQSFQRKRLTTELPSIKIPATIHACIRFDQRRRYKPNDIHDIGHATAALPYFDAFLTEHSLRHLLTREDLALDRLYGCTVISDPSEAIESLTAMVAEE